jgi:glycine oxidase
MTRRDRTIETPQAQLTVVIVGGGVIGCAAAVALSRAGAAVTLIERDRIGSGASHAAAGMLAPLSESDEEGPLVEPGMESLRLHATWSRMIEQLAGISIGRVARGTIMVAPTPGRLRELEERLAWQRRWDPKATLLDAKALRKRVPGLAPSHVGALHYPRESEVEAGRYTAALGRAAVASGAHLWEGRPVVALVVRGDRVTGVRTPEGTVDADAVLVATGSEPALLHAVDVPLPLSPIKGELIRLVPPRPLLRSNLFVPGGYLTPKADGSLLVGATQKPGRHDLAVDAESVRSLLEMAFAALPELRLASFAGTVVGLRPALPDRLPAIGPVPGLRGLWIATGHHRNGILLAPWTAERITRAIFGDVTALPHALLPDRLLTRAAASSGQERQARLT